MEENKNIRLKALANLAKIKEGEEVESPHVSADKGYFDKLRKKKDVRREEYQSDSEESYDEMRKTNAEIKENVNSHLTQEEKEQLAKETLSKKRREQGIQDPEVSKETIKDMFKFMK